MSRGRLPLLVDFCAHVQSRVRGVLRGTYKKRSVVEQRVSRMIRNRYHIFLPGRPNDWITSHGTL